MRNFELFLEELKSKGQLEFEKNKPLSSVSSIGTGGEAEFFILPNGAYTLCEVLQSAKSLKIPICAVGNSSNIIYSDRGFNGAVICTKNIKGYLLKKNSEGAKIFTGCGVMLPQLCQVALENELSGFEGLSSIPGTVGGALMSNAGAYGQSISDNLQGIFLLTKDCKVTFRRVDRGMFCYRKCYAVNEGEIVIGAVFTLKFGDKAEIIEKMQSCKRKRLLTQPVGVKSVGSFFKRPNIEEASPYFGFSAGKLADICGLKGAYIGGAAVSEKHANFIINTGTASSNDIILLAKLIKDIVFFKTGVRLEREPFLIGKIAYDVEFC